MAGIYRRRSVILASGRYVVPDDGMGFSLVPWKPVIEQRLGHGARWWRVLGAWQATWAFSLNIEL